MQVIIYHLRTLDWYSVDKLLDSILWGVILFGFPCVRTRLSLNFDTTETERKFEGVFKGLFSVSGLSLNFKF